MQKSELVFERFLIQYFVNILEETKKNDTREFKLKIVEKLLLFNLFLLRRLKDLGFYRYVCKQILNDDKYLLSALQFVKREIALGLMNSDFFYDPFSKLENWEVINSPGFPPILPIEPDFSRFRELDDLTESFLKKQLFKAKIEGDLEKIKVLEVMTKEQKTGFYSLNELLIDPFSEKPLTLNFMKKYERRLLTQNIILDELYHSKQKSPLISDYFLRINPENEKLILKISKIISEMIPSSQATFINTTKFINDLISIIHIKWFDLIESNRKWEILRKEYPFILHKEYFRELNKILNREKEEIKIGDFREEIDREYSKTIEKFKNRRILESTQQSSLTKKAIDQINSNGTIFQTIIQHLYIRGYFKNAIKGFKFLLDDKISPELRYLYLNNIGDSYYRLGKYEKAIKFLKDSLNVEIIDDYPYQKAITYKNIGNCYYYLEEKELSNEFMSHAEDLQEQLSDKELVKLHYNLACAYEKQRKFDKAEIFLLRSSSSDLTKGQLFNKIYQKFQMYEENRDLEGHLIKLQLEKRCLQQEIENIRYNYLLKKHDFQFIQAAESLERAIKHATLFEDKNQMNLIIEELAEFYIQTKNENKFIDLISNIDIDVKIPKIKIFQAVNHIFNNLANEGINIFKNYYKNLYLFNDEDFLFDISPIYRNGRSIPKGLPPIVWFFKPFIDFSYKKLEELENKLIQALENPKDKGALLWDIGRVYYNLGDIQKSIKYYKRGYEFFGQDLNNKIIRNLNIAGVYADLDSFQHAEAFISRGLKIIENKDNTNLINKEVLKKFLKGASQIYRLKQDYPKAIELIKDLLIKFPNAQELMELKKVYEELNEKYVFLHATDIPEIKKLLHSASLIFDKIAESSFEIDYSLIILAYCKSIEILLDEKLTKQINLSETLEPFYVEEREWIKRSVWKSLLPVLKNILNQRNPKSITIGKWPYVLRDLKKKEQFKNSRIIYYEFLSQLDEIIGERDIDIIIEVCESLVNYRNLSAHTKFHSKKEFLEEKPKIISNINDLLSLFQKSEDL